MAAAGPLLFATAICRASVRASPGSNTAMSFQPLYKYVDRDTLAEQVRKHAADPTQREVAIVDVRGKLFPSLLITVCLSLSLCDADLIRNSLHDALAGTDDDFQGGNIVSATNHPSSKFADQVQDLIYGPLKDYKQVIFHCHLSQQRGPKAAGQYAQARQAAMETGKLKDETQSKQQVLVLRGGFSEFQDKYKVSHTIPTPRASREEKRQLIFMIFCVRVHRKTQRWWKSTILALGSCGIRLQPPVSSLPHRWHMQGATS